MRIGGVLPSKPGPRVIDYDKRNAMTTMKNLFETAKIKDLAPDTLEVTSKTGLTTDHGVPVPDTDNWTKSPREKIHRFDHERIPEQSGTSLLFSSLFVHARGSAAHGYFRVFDSSAAKYTTAGVLTDPSRTTPVFVRFSTVQGARGSSDIVRDVRGFATKFYTEEGNWDLVGNNIPIFFIQDAMKFPDFVHAVKPEPHNEVPQGQTRIIIFGISSPEASHMVMWAMSDRAIPRSYRMMQGFGVNTFTLVNGEGERFFVKFHWLPELGVHSFTFTAKTSKKQSTPAPPQNTPSPYKSSHPPANTTSPSTSSTPRRYGLEELVPLQEIGEMVLNRTVDEFFAETEQVAFCTSHVVPGIGFSDDPLLQGRNFSYFDTQITRLGINWEQLPINRPVCPVMNHHRGGQHQNRIIKGQVNYWPNRFQAGPPIPKENGGYIEFTQKIEGMKARVRGAKFGEHYNQAELFLNSLSEHEKMHLINAFSFELSHCDDPQVYETYTKLLCAVNMDLAKTVAANVGGQVHSSPTRKPHHEKSAPLKPTIKSRRVAILVEAMKALLKAGGAVPYMIGPRRGKIWPCGKDGQRSTLFDALLMPSGQQSADTLVASGRCIHWVREAFGHLKAIGAVGEAVSVLHRALKLEVTQLEFASSDDSAVTSSYGVVTIGKYNVGSIATDALEIITGGDAGFMSSFAYEISQHRCWKRELDGLNFRVAY
ncbi:catalase [Favolaschia claudopus]|uniref:Catalase n=1 Tax=Favolaschia claudopus TaxID=2862362 RepID=A0AAW0ECH3_9AGAR